MKKLLFGMALLFVFSLLPLNLYGNVNFNLLSATGISTKVVLYEEVPLLSFDTIDMLLGEASEHLGTRYMRGACGPKAFDCSGFTSYVFRQCGIEIPRTANAQASRGELVEVDSMQPGDLIFFSSRRSGPRGIGHVGMVVSRNDSTNEITFIHASCKRGVTYQKFPDNGYYSRKFICAKRVI